MAAPTENGQIKVSATTDAAAEAQHAAAIARTLNENQSFCVDPGQYEWKYNGKKHTMVPLNYLPSSRGKRSENIMDSKIGPKNIRWECHLIWIVEGTLRSGESNILARRLFYLDEKSWLILYGEGFDKDNNIVSSYMLTREDLTTTSTRGTWLAIPNI